MHFSVEDFQRVLQRMTSEHGAGLNIAHVWLDVACIDQEVESVKMQEVGRQGPIFVGAELPFIWLSRHSTSDLENYLVQIHKVFMDVTGNNIAWGPEAVGDVPTCIQQTGWLDSAINTFQGFLSDPWFSSLWTLQEAYLRLEAGLLSREGTLIDINVPGYSLMTLNHVIRWASDIYMKLLRAPASQDDGVDWLKIHRLMQIIQEAGLYSLSSTSAIAAYSAARFRKTTRAEDRIYGIMQIFGLRLGTSVDPGRSFTLPELEEQLGGELITKSPVLAQLFVHTRPVPKQTSWRPGPFSEAPGLTNELTIHRIQIQVEISLSKPGIPYFKGSACQFKHLAGRWETAKVDPRWHPSYRVHTFQLILLDVTEEMKGTTAEELGAGRALDPWQTEEQHTLAKAVLQLFAPDDVYVVLLGTTDYYQRAERGGVSGLKYSIGLIVLREQHDDRHYWRRLGICFWPVDQTEEDMWQLMEGCLGAMLSQ
jgi:hypothetical protein